MQYGNLHMWLNLHTLCLFSGNSMRPIPGVQIRGWSSWMCSQGNSCLLSISFLGRGEPTSLLVISSLRSPPIPSWASLLLFMWNALQICKRSLVFRSLNAVIYHEIRAWVHLKDGLLTLTAISVTYYFPDLAASHVEVKAVDYFLIEIKPAFFSTSKSASV